MFNRLPVGFILLLLITNGIIHAQTNLSLKDMNAFQPQAGNWRIVGQVFMDRNRDIHDKPTKDTVAIEPTTKRKRKKRRPAIQPQTAPSIPPVVTFEPGTGIILNQNTDSLKDHLVTKWEHGDLLLELEVMLPKGSNSGIYLQGRYEVQLLDSWGVKHPRYADMGGIYRNWLTEPGARLFGIPPTSNSSKAPGLWQKLEILFRAPRFDSEGRKTSSARFEYVDLNGVRIHENVEVSLPTGGPIGEGEVKKGPLMIQGDHGPVALRNIKYTQFSESQVSIRNLRYESYKGSLKSLFQLDTMEVIDSGVVNRIDVRLADAKDEYGLFFEGTLVIPEKDTYIISVGYTGGVQFQLDGEILLDRNTPSGRNMEPVSKTLSQGEYPFHLVNFKSAPWRNPRLALYIRTASTFAKPFHSYESYPPNADQTRPILVEPTQEARLLRAFVRFRDNSPKLSHTIGVGTPQGVHFVYDLESAHVVAAWRGKFVDATPMWNNRGDGSFRPNGSVLWTFLDQPLAQLTDSLGPFPDRQSRENILSRGYRLKAETGIPVFLEEFMGVQMETSIQPDASQKYLVQETIFSGPLPENCFFKLAEGPVMALSDGSFAVGDQQFYIQVLEGGKAFTRSINGTTELLLPVDGSPIRYELIW